MYSVEQLWMSAPANLFLLLLLLLLLLLSSFAPIERNDKSQIQGIMSISYQHVLLVNRHCS